MKKDYSNLVSHMRHVVILGGGFAGVAAGLELIQHPSKDITITLVDKNDFHLFTPSLYEVATSEAPQQNIAIPFREIFDKKVAFVQDVVKKIDTQKKEVELRKNKKISYDYLVITLGSESAYYHIPGLQKYAVALKSLEEAVHIKNNIKTMCCKEGKCNKKVNIVIGGGGFSGTELAEELLTYNNKLAVQHGLAKDCMNITIIQGSDKLLKELDAHVSDLAKKRIASKQLHFAFGEHIKEVTKNHVITDDNKKYPYNILIWTGGVIANHMAVTSNIPTNKNNQIPVNNFLQAEHFEHIFVAGDMAGFVDPKTQQSVPGVAQVAEEQGKIAGGNVYRMIMQKPLHYYHYRHFGYIVPMRGRFASAELMYHIHIDGFFGWILQQLVFFRYMLSILPFWKAFKKWNTFELSLEQ